MRICEWPIKAWTFLRSFPLSRRAIKPTSDYLNKSWILTRERGEGRGVGGMGGEYKIKLLILNWYHSEYQPPKEKQEKKVS
jgi:hypothetical protein